MRIGVCLAVLSQVAVAAVLAAGVAVGPLAVDALAVRQADKGTYLVLRVNTDDAKTVSEVQQIITRRLLTMGVANPVVTGHQGIADQLFVSLPPGTDVDRAKRIIRNTAVLQIKVVEGGPATDEQSLLKAHGGKVPEGMEVVPGPSSANPSRDYYLVRQTAALSSGDVRTARRTVDELNLPAVDVTLVTDAVAKFERVTSENIGRRLAIILDGLVQSAPTIRSRISSPDIRITGSFTRQEADDLAIILRTGALPASVAIVSEGVGK